MIEYERLGQVIRTIETTHPYEVAKVGVDLFGCSRCGATVSDQDKHTAWHFTLINAGASFS